MNNIYKSGFTAATNCAQINPNYNSVWICKELIPLLKAIAPIFSRDSNLTSTNVHPSVSLLVSTQVVKIHESYAIHPCQSSMPFIHASHPCQSFMPFIHASLPCHSSMLVIHASHPYCCLAIFGRSQL